MTRILTVPGWGSSGPEHWQSVWEQAYGHQRVEQRNWEHPFLRDWVSALDEKVGQSDEATVLVAHSLGCHAVAHWACCVINHPVVGALLVAPPDLARTDTPQEVLDFAPMHLEPLPFSSVLVASTNDPYITLQRAEELAAAWGSQFVNVGAKGHINSDSKLQLWEEGHLLLERLINPS